MTAAGTQSSVSSSTQLLNDRSEEFKKERPEKTRVDLRALTGLRGLAALHVTIFHYIFNAPVERKPNLMGSVQMPMFFIMSGFTLTLMYGQRDMSRPNSWLNFFIARIARLAPTYYFMVFVSIALRVVFKALGKQDGGPRSTSWWATLPQAATWSLFLPVQSWLNLQATGRHTVLGVAWFISTMIAFYLIFPRVLRRAQRTATTEIPRLILKLFVLQFVMGYIFVVPSLWLKEEAEANGPETYWWSCFSDFRKTFVSSYWCGTGNPLTRWPIFLMGALLGAYRYRSDYDFLGDWIQYASNCVRGASRKFSPAGSQTATFLSRASIPHLQALRSEGSEITPSATPSESDCDTSEGSGDDLQDPKLAVAETWARRTDLIHLAYAALNIVGPVGYATYKNNFAKHNYWNWTCQFWSPLLQALLVYSLTMDEGRSKTARVFNSRPLQWLGEVSLELYLCHVTVLQMVTAAYKGLEKEWSITKRPWHEKTLPFSVIFLAVAISLVFSWALHRFLAVPARRFIRALPEETHWRLWSGAGYLASVGVALAIANATSSDL